MILYRLLAYFCCLVLLFSCIKDEPTPNPYCADKDLTTTPFDPQFDSIVVPRGFPKMPIPPTNPLTKEGIELGRRLFYDPILSSDSTQSCSSCHIQQFAFTDGKAVSTGVTGQQGTRSAMSLVNVGYFTKGLFWDGLAADLEEQAEKPVENPVEMHETWTNVVKKLQCHPTYPLYFRKAFGISTVGEITKELAAKAMAQFERTIVSSGKSRYQRLFVNREGFPEDDEQNGNLMYNNLSALLPDAQCFHCHGGSLLTQNEYFDNGIEAGIANINEYPDKGRGKITNKDIDYGKFRAPTLHNIALTAPYMHDGRFATLREVLEHYNTGVHDTPNLDRAFLKTPELGGMGLTNAQVDDILLFLATFTDSDLTTDPRYSSPF